MIDADAVVKSDDGMSPQGENGENHTNEAKFDDSVIIIQNKDNVGVAANSCVDSTLDNGPEDLGESRGKDVPIGELIRHIPAVPTAAEILRPHLPRSP